MTFSLPTQRCFQDTRGNPLRTFLFSAYAEVFLSLESHVHPGASFLCLRRGVSQGSARHGVGACFSLPTQRCFYRFCEHPGEMDPFLCLRRGVSGYYRWNGLLRRLFSAYAEVFREAIDSSLSATAFLCLRRGVSVNSDPTEYTAHFSLPTQRCFRLFCRVLCLFPLFSAYAEVFLLTAPDVCTVTGFSLPTQRCFCC